MYSNKDKNTSVASEDELKSIFIPLNFEEQLSVARESDQLRNVFVNHIWKVDYGTLKIFKGMEECFVVTNESNANQIMLTDEEALRHFIEFYAENVKILIFYRYIHQMIKRWNGYDEEINDFILVVARNLEHLESLEFHGLCANDLFNKSETVNALLQMKNLKHLRLHPSACSEIKYKYFCQLASSKLEVLQLVAELKPDDEDDNSESEFSSLIHSDQLKELQISTTFDPNCWSHKYVKFLTTFKSLKTLTLELTDEIDNCMWEKFVTNCQELEKLSISYTNFKNITHFFIPPKLSVLNLNSCEGLTHNNLKQILQEAKLTEFISTSTYYEGEFKDFQIASTILTLHMDDSDMCKLRSAYESNDNLKNLKWNHTHKRCTNTKCMTSLALCKNLETLYLKPLTQVTLDALLQLNHLRKLTTSINDSAQWSCLIDLLKHFSLSDLTVEISEISDAVPAKGFPTNISTLNVSAYFQEAEIGFALNFFLDLFCQNPDLKLSLRIKNIGPEESLKSLINHEKFPRNLKAVVVWGITLNCDDLRQDFDDTYKIVDRCPAVFWNGPDIVLSRK